MTESVGVLPLEKRLAACTTFPSHAEEGVFHAPPRPVDLVQILLYLAKLC